MTARDHVRREAPGQSARLALGEVAYLLGVKYEEIACALGVSRPAVSSLTHYGQYPKRLDPESVRNTIRNLLASRGATTRQLAVLFDTAPPPGSTQRPRAILDPRTLKRAPFCGLRLADAPNEVDMLIAKQVMTPATRRHFKLFSNPFDGPVERDDQFYMSEEIAYVRELVWQCALNAGFTALIGESGAGKTTILDDLAERLKRETRTVVLIKPSIVGMEETRHTGQLLKSADILQAIIATLDAGAPMPTSLQARTQLATRLLAGGVRAGAAHVLAVEEAHRMPESTMRHLKRLHELREGRRPLLGILLLGQPELQQRLIDGLRSGDLREVAQRCEVVGLPPLGKDLQGYLECRARSAGGKGLDALLDASAVTAIGERLTAKVGQQRVPMSYPLVVNNVVTRALNVAAQIGAPIVTADVVRGM